MKNSKILILLLAIIMIVSISAVSAEDIADSTDLASSDDSTTLKVDESVDDIQTDTESETLADDPVDTGNFTALQELIDEDGRTELTLDKDYARVAGEKDIEISKEFTIFGYGKYAINANDLGRIFNVTESGSLTLVGLTLVDGQAESGGAIFSEGDLTIDNCIFESNNANQTDGGAIYSACALSISDSKFYNNGAPGFGSAICIKDSVGQLNVKVDGCEFTQNAASWGTIYANNVSLIVNNTLFNNNTVRGNSGGMGSRGSAIAVESSLLEVYNSNFTNNVAEYTGSAIYNNYLEDPTEEIFNIIDNCRFENNTLTSGYETSASALMVGGGVYQKINLNITNTKFIDNNAQSASTLYFSGGDLTINGSEFTNNKGRYSAIYFTFTNNKNVTLTVSNTNFTGNNATLNNDGTTVYIKRNAKLTNVKFESNAAKSDAKAINIVGGSNVEIKDSTFTNNGNSTEYAIYNDGTLKVENNTLSNHIFNTESATFIRPGSTVTIDPIENVTYGNPVVVCYDIVNGTDNVTVSIKYNNDEEQLVEDANYTIDNDKVTIYGLFADEYLIIIFNNGDYNHEGNSSYAYFNVTKATPVIEITDVAVNEYGEVYVTANITGVKSGFVAVLINNTETGKNCTDQADIRDGYIDYAYLEPLAKGSYTVQITYPEDDYGYTKAESAQVTVEIIKEYPVIEFINVAVNDYGAIVVNANITKDISGTVTFLFINTDTDKNMTVPIVIGENGTIEYDELEPFEEGSYTVVITYAGDDKYYAASNTNFDADVNKTYITPKTTNLNVVGSEVSVTVDLGVNATGNVSVVYPSGYVDNVTIKNGTVSFVAVFQDEFGPLSLVLGYAGDDNYYGFYEYFIDFTIKEATFIKAGSASAVYNTNGKWNINLIGAKSEPIVGAKIKVTINGKVYTAKTNSKGNAVVTIPAKLVPKSYNAVITYAGTGLYDADTATYKFTVKKAKAKITAKKKTFKKSKKVKKYTITLKDNKGKAIKKAKVTIKVGKKTFKAKTNAKGKAVFKLKKLTKKAKYTAKITYKGNKYFNKVTKKVKITIK